MVATAQSVRQERPRAVPGSARPGLARAGAALAAGVALVVAFPPLDAWWAAPLGVALLALASHGCRVRTAAGLGLVTGIVCFAPLLQWTAIDARIGWWPWLLLSLSQAVFVAVLAGAAAWCTPLVERSLWTWPLLTGALWVGSEALRSRLPFGGFPWGKLAFSQADSPLVRLAALGGAPLVTFGVAVTGGLLAAAGWWTWHTARGTLGATKNPWWVRGGALVGTAVLVVLSGLAVPYTPPAGPEVTVAIVQGNVPRIGLDFNAQRRAVLDNHVDATLALAKRVDRGDIPRPDLVIWPENSSDIDPLRNADAYGRIEDAATAIRAPILVGAVLDGPGTSTRNSGIVWSPTAGPTDRYVKQHPVPFAEYLPLRSVVRAITPKADLVGHFVSGNEPGVLRVGPATLGDVICFEVAYDNLVRDTVTGGAELLVVQTNNATFDESEARQQLAMVRLRAIEHGRPALMASTVGISGFVAADGTVTDASGFNTRHVAVRTLRLGERRTLATRVGVLPELVIGLAGLAAVGAGYLLRRRAPAATIETAPRNAAGAQRSADGEDA